MFCLLVSEEENRLSQCRKIENFLDDGYSVSVVLSFAPPIPYDMKIGEEFLTGLLGKVRDDAGSCTPFKHNSRTGEVRTEIMPAGGVNKGRKMIKKTGS